MDNLQSFTNSSNTADPQADSQKQPSQQGSQIQGLGADAVDQRTLPSSFNDTSLNCQANCSLGVSTNQSAVVVKNNSSNSPVTGVGLLLLAAISVGIFAHKVLKA